MIKFSIVLALMVAGCVANSAAIAAPIQIDISAAPINNPIDESVPQVLKTWYTIESPLTTASNMEQLYAAISDMLSRDECGCQKGDPLCDCEYYYSDTVSAP